MSDAPFTDASWDKLPHTGLIQRSSRNWAELHDLAVEAHARTESFCKLSFPEWRDLISAVNSGLPINITFRGRTSCCIVDQILTLAPRVTHNVYVRYWGFSHPISLSEIDSVDVPSTVYH